MDVHDTLFNVFIHDLVFYVHSRFYDSHDILLSERGSSVWVYVTFIFMIMYRRLGQKISKTEYIVMMTEF